jgi:hypothetical protein
MAKRNPRTRQHLRTGDTFAVPLEEGGWGACRVVRASGAPHYHVLVGACAWVGDEPPSLDEPRLRLTTRLTWGSRGQPLLFWVRQGPLPKGARYVGTLPACPGDESLAHQGYDDWENFLRHVYWQHHQDEEHGIPPATDEAELQRRQGEAARRYAAERRRKARAKLEPKKLFPDPEDDPEDEIEARSFFRKVFRDAVAALDALGPDGDEVARLDVLRLCIERLNAAEQEDRETETYEIDIDTYWREILCDVFYDLMWVAGMEEYDRTVGEVPWRDW